MNYRKSTASNVSLIEAVDNDNNENSNNNYYYYKTSNIFVYVITKIY